MKYAQGEITIDTSEQSIYEITQEINRWLEQQSVQQALLTTFIKHTSASLFIQENASSDVLHDIENFFKKLVPEDPNLYQHTIEGKDDMPAHLKSLLTQVSLTIPVSNSQLELGTWQGVFLFEHRIQKQKRKIHLTLIGK